MQAADKALLPAGFVDVLPPDAAFEAASVERLMAHFESYGYERVKPPLLEFEDSLLAGTGAALADQTFRLMDPQSHRLLGLRPDMTMQIARIARRRLAGRPRPLRLSYAGQVVRVRGYQLRSERQFGQVGAEIVGTADEGADAEVILMAADALARLGIDGLTVDLGLPTLVSAVLGEQAVPAELSARLRAALDRKDIAAVSALTPSLGNAAVAVLTALMQATGPAETALAALAELPLPDRAARARQQLASVAAQITAGAPELIVSIDPVENLGFEYHTGVTFTLFARGARGELGRGGRYLAGDGTGDSTGEAATGVTLFMDSILRTLPPPPPRRRLFLPAGTPPSDARRLREEGWIAVAGFPTGAGEPADAMAEAVRLGCSDIFINGEIRKVAPPPR